VCSGLPVLVGLASIRRGFLVVVCPDACGRLRRSTAGPGSLPCDRVGMPSRSSSSVAVFSHPVSASVPHPHSLALPCGPARSQGTVGGKRYFDCEKRHGVLVTRSKVKPPGSIKWPVESFPDGGFGCFGSGAEGVGGNDFMKEFEAATQGSYMAVNPDAPEVLCRSPASPSSPTASGTARVDD